MRRLEIAVLFVLAVVGGSVGSAWYFHQAPIRTDKAAVTAIVAETLAEQPKPKTDSAAVEAIVADVLDKQPKPTLDTVGVRSIVSQMLAAEDAKNSRIRRRPSPRSIPRASIRSSRRLPDERSAHPAADERRTRPAEPGGFGPRRTSRPSPIMPKSFSTTRTMWCLAIPRAMSPWSRCSTTIAAIAGARCPISPHS